MSDIRVVYGTTEFLVDEDGARQIVGAVNRCVETNTSTVLTINDPLRDITFVIGPSIPILIDSPIEL